MEPERLWCRTAKLNTRRADGRSLEGFNSNATVNGVAYSLLAAENLFCCLNGNVPEEKLDVSEFTTCCMANARAGPLNMPHVRRSSARLCRLAGGEPDQIQFLLGHIPIQTIQGATSVASNSCDAPATTELPSSRTQHQPWVADSLRNCGCSHFDRTAAFISPPKRLRSRNNTHWGPRSM